MMMRKMYLGKIVSFGVQSQHSLDCGAGPLKIHSKGGDKQCVAFNTFSHHRIFLVFQLSLSAQWFMMLD